jgi:hypothetical protein
VVLHQVPLFVGGIVALVVVVVAWTQDIEERAAVDVVHLVVGHPVRFDQPSELEEQLRRERTVASDALGDGDEAEQALRIASRERRHSPPRIRRMTNGLQPLGWLTLEETRTRSGGGTP